MANQPDLALSKQASDVSTPSPKSLTPAHLVRDSLRETFAKQYPNVIGASTIQTLVTIVSEQFKPVGPFINGAISHISTDMRILRIEMQIDNKIAPSLIEAYNRSLANSTVYTLLDKAGACAACILSGERPSAANVRRRLEHQAAEMRQDGRDLQPGQMLAVAVQMLATGVMELRRDMAPIVKRHYTTLLAESIYHDRLQVGRHGDAASDWADAERLLRDIPSGMDMAAIAIRNAAYHSQR